MRVTLEAAVRDDSEQQATPQDLAAAHGLYIVEEADATRWLSVVAQQAERLLAVYMTHQSLIRELHASLQGSKPGTFGEFFCWYHHLAYSRAIDRLEQAGMIHIPRVRFMGTLWQGNASPEFFASLAE